MTKKFEIIKGSEADFEGAPEWAVCVSKGIYGNLYWEEDSRSKSGNRFKLVSGCFEGFYGVCREIPFTVIIAERRPIAEPQPDAGGWIEWKGGEFPPVGKGVKIDRKYRDGHVASNVGCGSDCIWSHSGSAEDIIAYRLSKPEQVEQPESPVTWDGNGLPPVGVECEVSVANVTGKCKIVYISETYSVFIHNGSESCFNTYLCTFRPIRSVEDIEREKAIQEMKSILEQKCGTLGLCGLALAEGFYDAGFRKVGK